jgi:hypothetical protein
MGTSVTWGSGAAEEITPDTRKAPEAKEPLVPLKCGSRSFGGGMLGSAQRIQLVVRGTNEPSRGAILAAARRNVLLQVVMRQGLVFV